MKKCIIVIIALLYSFLGVNMLFAAAGTWTLKADFGGTARYLAVGFSIGSKGYIGTGAVGGTSKTFSQERMQYLDQEGKVVYAAKDGKSTKVFPAMEWLAAMCSHIPNRGEQMVRYYGYSVMLPGGNGSRKGLMMPSPASSNLRETKRPSEKTGRA